MRLVSYKANQVTGGEEGLIGELTRKYGREMSILQQCNDENDIVHAVFFGDAIDDRGNFVEQECEFNYRKIKRSIKSQKILSFVTVDRKSVV